MIGGGSGPADVFVVVAGFVAACLLVARLLWALSDPRGLAAWRESLRKPPPSDPTVRGVPAKRVTPRR